MYKPTINTSYKGVCRLYETCGRSDYCLRAAEDILFIHGFDITKTPGYEDLTSDQKDLFAAHCVKYMNSVGMNTKITMYPKTVHFVREYQYCSFPEWDEEIQKNIRWQIGREWIILKANGRTRKFKKYLDDGRTEADIDKTVTKEFEYLRVDWRQNGTNVWFHVTAPDEYY